jgi:hypothetical protein
MKKETGNNKIEKELRQIRNLLILVALKSGANSDEVHYATGNGSCEHPQHVSCEEGKKEK